MDTYKITCRGDKSDSPIHTALIQEQRHLIKRKGNNFKIDKRKYIFMQFVINLWNWLS